MKYVLYNITIYYIIYNISYIIYHISYIIYHIIYIYIYIKYCIYLFGFPSMSLHFIVCQSIFHTFSLHPQLFRARTRCASFIHLGTANFWNAATDRGCQKMTQLTTSHTTNPYNPWPFQKGNVWWKKARGEAGWFWLKMKEAYWTHSKWLASPRCWLLYPLKHAVSHTKVPQQDIRALKGLFPPTERLFTYIYIYYNL